MRILQLHPAFGEPQMTAALEWALVTRCYTWEGVRRWLQQQIATASMPEAEVTLIPTAPPTPHVAPPNLAQYQALVPLGGPHGD